MSSFVRDMFRRCPIERAKNGYSKDSTGPIKTLSDKQLGTLAFSTNNVDGTSDASFEEDLGSFRALSAHHNSCTALFPGHMPPMQNVVPWSSFPPGEPVCCTW
jgi:hypothetical protein